MATAKITQVRWRKVAKRVIIFGGGFLVIVAVVLLLLPVWMSNEQGRAYILARINKNAEGTVAVDRWSVSWWRGMELDGLTVTLKDGRKIVDCPRLQSELTLWSILWGTWDFGDTRIAGAKLAITKYVDGSTDLTRLFPAATAPGGMLRQVRGAFTWTSGSLLIGSEASLRAIRLKDFSAEVTIASPASTFFVRARGMSDLPGEPGARIVTCNAALPPMSKWPAPLAECLPGVEFTGGTISTDVIADWLNLGSGWGEALGETLTSLQFRSADTRPQLGLWSPQLDAVGTGGQAIHANILMTRWPAVPVLRVPAPAEQSSAPPVNGRHTQEFYCTANLRWSAPLRRILRQVNPLFGEVTQVPRDLRLRVERMAVELAPPRSADQPAVRGSLLATIDLGPGKLANAGIVREILRGERVADAEYTMAVLPFTVRLEELTLTAERLGFDLSSPEGLEELRFSGSTEVTGALALEVTHVRGSPGLGGMAARIPIRGTVQKPLVARP